MGKKTLLVIIDNLEKGGAEVLLVGILPELNQRFNIILVTLKNEVEFKKQEIICTAYYSLGFKNKLSLVKSVYKLKEIIKKHKPDIIHSHLIYSSLVARMACPISIPLLYSIHGELSKSDFNNSKVLTFLEKCTIRENHSLLAVSNVVLEDYKNTISSQPRSFVLHNYIADVYLDQQPICKNYDNLQSVKLVAVGNIKAAKNYGYLLNAFSLLKEYPVSLDIYGNTNQHLFESLQSQIDKDNLKVSFKGAANNVLEELPKYDLYLLSSKNEGFGIAVIEAMACGLPALISDIAVMREITLGNALFFNLDNPQNLAVLIKEVLKGKHNLSEISAKGLEISRQYSKKEYLKRLFEIYDEVIN